MSWWVRTDGAERWLEHLDGPPQAPPPSSPAWRRFEQFLDALYDRLPWWDDALMLAVLLPLAMVALIAIRG